MTEYEREEADKQIEELDRQVTELNKQVTELNKHMEETDGLYLCALSLLKEVTNITAMPWDTELQDRIQAHLNNED